MEDQTSTGSLQAIRTAIRKIARTYGIDMVDLMTATVTAVDRPTRTCTVTPVTGKADTQIDGVLLSADPNDGELKVPAIGSTVVVLTSTHNKAYVIGCSDLQEWSITIGNTVIDLVNGTIQMGDGSYGGLVKVVDLVTKINRLENMMNSHIHPDPVTGFTGASTTPITPLTARTDIENTTVKHGTN